MSLEPTFRNLEDPVAYVKGEICKGAEIVEAYKVAKIKARQGTLGESISTKLKEGFTEVEKETVTIDETTGQPGWIVTNPDGEQYIVKDSVFHDKYNADPEEPGTFIPKGAPVLAVKLSENIQMVKSWGTQNIRSGGYLTLNKGKNGNYSIYGIDEEVFKTTYKKTDKTPEECRQAAIEFMGITPEQLKAVEERLAGKKTEPSTPGTDAPEI